MKHVLIRLLLQVGLDAVLQFLSTKKFKGWSIRTVRDDDNKIMAVTITRE